MTRDGFALIKSRIKLRADFREKGADRNPLKKSELDLSQKDKLDPRVKGYEIRALTILEKAQELEALSLLSALVPP
jgi:hypothetical protein